MSTFKFPVRDGLIQTRGFDQSEHALYTCYFYNTVYYSSFGWQPCCIIVYYSSLDWQPCCTIIYYSSPGWQPCCTIVYYSSFGWQPCCTTVYYSSLGWQPCSIYYNILQHIEIDNSLRLRPSEYIKFSLNGVIDYYSILKFLFYKIFFMIRTNCRLRSRFVNLNFCLRLFFFSCSFTSNIDSSGHWKGRFSNIEEIECNCGSFFIRKYSRTGPLKCAHIVRRQYTVVQSGWQPSNQRQNFRLPANVKRANRVY